MKTLSLVCLTTLVAAAGVNPDGNGGSQREAFYRALRQGQSGQVPAAVAALERLAEEFPTDSYAAEALGQAARLWEEQLYRPARALVLYRKLLEEYPNSRLARRARSRAEWLEAHLDQGERVLGEYLRITRTAAQVGLEQAVRDMRRLLEAHPRFSLAGEGRYWIAGLLARTGRQTEAEKVYQQLASGSGALELRARALIDLANLRLARGNLDGAEDAYRQLGQLGPRWQQAAQGGLQQVAHASTRRSIPLAAGLVYAFALLVIWLAFILGLRREKFRPSLLLPTLETWLYLLVMGGLYVWAASGTRHTAQAVAALAVLHLPLLLPAGWHWKLVHQPHGGWLLVGRLLVLGAGSLAALVLAVSWAGLGEQLMHTLEFGIKG